MKGKNIFTQSKIDELRKLIQDKINSTSNKQKKIRQQMRGIGFYISNFGINILHPSDFEKLISSERITII